MEIGIYLYFKDCYFHFPRNAIVDMCTDMCTVYFVSDLHFWWFSCKFLFWQGWSVRHFIVNNPTFDGVWRSSHEPLQFDQYNNALFNWTGWSWRYFHCWRQRQWSKVEDLNLEKSTTNSSTICSYKSLNTNLTNRCLIGQ